MMLDRVLTAVAARGATGELFHYRGQSRPVIFSDNRLQSVETSSREVYALRVIMDGRVGFATATGNIDEAALVDRALATATCAEESELDLADPAPSPGGGLVCDRVVGLEPEQLVTMGQHCVDRVRDRHGDAQVAANLVASLHGYGVGNTKGCHHSYQTTSFSVKLSASVVQEGNFLDYEIADQRVDRDIDLQHLIDMVNLELSRGRTNAVFTSGQYPVVFAPEPLQEIVCRYAACMEGRAITSGFSPWTDRVGEQVLGSGITLHDDPAQPGRPGSIPVDDEGVVCRRRTLIDRGLLSGLILDLASARELGLQPTGNGFRQAPLYTLPPQSRPLNLVLEPGTGDAMDLIAKTGTCVLVSMLIGAWAGNPYTGEINGNIGLGYLVRDGEIVGRIKDAMVSVNAFAAMGDRLQWLSGDRRWCAGTMGMEWDALLPWACVGDTVVSARR